MERRLAVVSVGICVGLSAAFLSGCGTTSGSSGVSVGAGSGTSVQGTTNGLGGARGLPWALLGILGRNLAPVARASHGGDGTGDGVTDRFVSPVSVTIAATFGGVRRSDGTILELFTASVSSPAILNLSNGATVDWMRSGTRIPAGTYDAFVFDCLYIQQKIPVDANQSGTVTAGEEGQFRLWMADQGTAASDARRTDLQLDNGGSFFWMDTSNGAMSATRTGATSPYQNVDTPATRQTVLFTTPVTADGSPADVVVTFTGNEFFYDDLNGDGIFNPGMGGYPNTEGSGVAGGSWYPIFPSADVTYRARRE